MKRVRAELSEVSKGFPTGVSYDIRYDTTRFIEVSIKEVVKTLGEAMVLVILVVYLFLQSWRATLIPGVAVPVSLIGTFAGMQALGFSINTLTLFGMVLAIGIVVDDAIVVVENCERHMTQGKLSAEERRQAGNGRSDRAGDRHCAGVVRGVRARRLSRRYHRGALQTFAITISIAVIISGFVALTLSPALCALVPQAGRRTASWTVWLFNRTFSWMQGRHISTVGMALTRRVLSVAVFAVLLAGVFLLFRIIPNSFCRKKTRDISSRSCNYRMGPRSSARIRY